MNYKEHYTLGHRTPKEPKVSFFPNKISHKDLATASLRVWKQLSGASKLRQKQGNKQISLQPQMSRKSISKLFSTGMDSYQQKKREREKYLFPPLGNLATEIRCFMGYVTSTFFNKV